MLLDADLLPVRDVGLIKASGAAVAALTEDPTATSRVRQGHFDQAVRTLRAARESRAPVDGALPDPLARHLDALSRTSSPEG